MAKKNRITSDMKKLQRLGQYRSRIFFTPKEKKKFFLQPATTQPGQCPLNQVASGWETVDVRCLMASSHAYLVDM